MTEFLNVINFVESLILENKLDVVHDILSYLAIQISEMNNKKNEEIKGFLSSQKGEPFCEKKWCSPDLIFNYYLISPCLTPFRKSAPYGYWQHIFFKFPPGYIFRVAGGVRFYQERRTHGYLQSPGRYYSRLFKTRQSFVKYHFYTYINCKSK